MNENRNLSERIKELTAAIESSPDSSDLFYKRGKLYWKAGRKGEAMTDFNRAVLINPKSPAVMYLEMANDIMDFYNTDLYNP